jgi:hypothetical protein
MTTPRLPRTPSKPRTTHEIKLVQTIGKKIHQDLFKKNKPVEWLAFEAETARSTIRRMFDGDGNIGVVTLDRVARALGYKDVIDFFKSM